MSRRRAAREQEKEEFLQQNPELIRYNTRIEVAAEEDEKNEWEDAGFSVESRVDGGPPFEAFTREVLDTPDFTLIDEAEGPGFFLYAGSTDPFLNPLEIQANGPELFEAGPAALSLSENGFGVASGDEFPFFQVDEEVAVQLLDEEEEDEIPDGLDSLGAGEVLFLDVDAPLKPLVPKKPEPQEPGTLKEEDGPFILPGGTSFGIDFTSEGTGSVVISLFGVDQKETIEFTESLFVGRGGGGLQGFDVDLPEGVFQYAEVTTTGSLEISIVGIDLETNFEPFLFFGD